MPRYLPRELGEYGALRVSDVNQPRSRADTRRKIQRWIREEFGERAQLDKAARELRIVNLRRSLASRTQRPARVS